MTDPRTDLDRLDRTMHSITLGVMQDREARKRQRQQEGLMEREDQFVIDVEGTAEEFPSWQQVDLKFNVLFVHGVSHQDSPFIRPVFTYGAYIPQGGPIGLLACVTRWDITDRDETIGCRLAIGAVATDLARSFRGEVHCLFQGYGAPADMYGDLEALEEE